MEFALIHFNFQDMDHKVLLKPLCYSFVCGCEIFKDSSRTPFSSRSTHKVFTQMEYPFLYTPGSHVAYTE